MLNFLTKDGCICQTEVMQDETTPDQIPNGISTIRTSDYAESSPSLDAVIAQNDDLMARLKVTLRRLSLLETEHGDLKKDLIVQNNWNRNLKDQLAVWKEKENLWTAKKQQLEAELQLQENKDVVIKDLTAELSRLTRYRSRVQTWVKPYLHQLKDFANRLGHELKYTRTQLDTQTSVLENLQGQHTSLRNEFDTLNSRHHIEMQALAESRDAIRKAFERQVLELEASNASLKQSAEQLPLALDRQDALENMNIQLRRERDELLNKFASERSEIRNQTQNLQQELAKRQIIIDDLKQKSAQQDSQLKKLESTNRDLGHQLDSTRQLWNTKSEEVEKFKLSLRSLEKINADLSRQLASNRPKPLDH